jgi:hypothetical protein
VKDSALVITAGFTTALSIRKPSFSGTGLFGGSCTPSVCDDLELRKTERVPPEYAGQGILLPSAGSSLRGSGTAFARCG